MNLVIQLILLSYSLSVVLSEQPFQQDPITLTKLDGWIPIKVKRTLRSLNSVTSPAAANGILRSYSSDTVPVSSPSEASVKLRQRSSRWPYFGTYQLPFHVTSSNTKLSNRIYRSGLPSLYSSDAADSEEAENNVQQISLEQIGRLRFLGWLFGRPSVPPYPNYSVLEQAAGMSYGSRLPSVPYARPYSPLVVEECVELLNPLTDHIIEECQDVPYYHR